ncbi:hypothetical protein WJX81_007129 [Elliptochloris bilobata]|uniref:Uncharacterized protein n=1 Tax=Elliptochloris bilobata TaxID=381761 RepID=A0AAW1S369_9CHLO
MAGPSAQPFDFQAAKARVIRATEATMPVQVKRFLATPSFDALALALAQHAAARFEAAALAEALERAERLRMEGLRPGAALLRFRRYADHQATTIFEALFQAVVAVAVEAMPQQAASLQATAGELLLTSHFNLHARR